MKRMIAVFAGVAASTASLAGSEMHSGSVAAQNTNWLEAFAIPQFDTQGGTRQLDSVEIHLTGEVSGIARAESTDAEPATISLDLQATIAINLGMTQLAVVIPVANTMFNASAFDGTVDFDGTSGATFTTLNQQDHTVAILTLPGDLAPFIGLGMVNLNGTAEGQSTGSGAGNLITAFQTDGAMEYEIFYNFTPVPTPGALALAGVAGMTAFRRRR